LVSSIETSRETSRTFFLLPLEFDELLSGFFKTFSPAALNDLSLSHLRIEFIKFWCLAFFRISLG